MEAAGQILTAAQMQAAEQALIDAGETVESLMERAGAGAAEWVWRMAAGRPVTVLCGPGNNGGDGYVIARVLSERGLSVSVVAPLEPKTEAAKAARAAWGGEPVEHADGDVLVDCLFGTGLTRPLSEELRALLLDLVYSHEKWVAVDLPSGVDSDTGAMLNDRLTEYDLTIALGSWKRAHWLMPASALMGTRKLVDIGIGRVDGATQLAEPPKFYPPDADDHKYSRGLLAVIGGEMPGAAMLAARAALHGGAGYAKLFADHRDPMTPDELVVSSEPLEQALSDKRISALLVGPGLGRGEEAQARLGAALSFSGALVIDGDALTLLRPEMLGNLGGELVLTPHAGEMASLCEAFGVTASGKVGQAQALADATGAVVVAKGPDTVIASPEGRLHIMPPATSWLSMAGTGDVLAGVVASQWATGEPAMDAAATACFLHAEAARLAGPVFSASDLIKYIPEAYARFL